MRKKRTIFLWTIVFALMMMTFTSAMAEETIEIELPPTLNTIDETEYVVDSQSTCTSCVKVCDKNGYCIDECVAIICN